MCTVIIARSVDPYRMELQSFAETAVPYIQTKACSNTLSLRSLERRPRL